MLRVTCPTATAIELLNGDTVRLGAATPTTLAFLRHADATAAARQLVARHGGAVSFVAFRTTDSGGLVATRVHPRDLCVAGAPAWVGIPTGYSGGGGGGGSGGGGSGEEEEGGAVGVGSPTDSGAWQLEGVWAAYERLGAAGPVEEEWAAIARAAAAWRGEVLIADRGGPPAAAADDGAPTIACRLCGGEGTKVCHRCAGGQRSGGVGGGCSLCDGEGRLVCRRCGGKGRQLRN